MTETQRKFKSDAQAAFESMLLESEEAFNVCARIYLEERQEIDSFLEFCWNKYLSFVKEKIIKRNLDNLLAERTPAYRNAWRKP